MPAVVLGPNRASGRTITEQLNAFDAHNPHVYRALDAWPPAALLRRQLPYGVAGLNNNFTALYARRLIDEHPHWAGVFKLRRRRAA
ncbi:hypothetical protein [Streptomyces sp. NPDC001137]|uniref:hypothetical protein n=1 Tax=Streptomyces sp. NPDC001137 TaxID=3154378 RepID=UPI003319D4D9